jgi:hypothetical protein
LRVEREANNLLRYVTQGVGIARILWNDTGKVKWNFSRETGMLIMTYGQAFPYMRESDQQLRR